jgi:ribosome-associated toxin RatA of RatAB toxin-antitoxin module
LITKRSKILLTTYGIIFIILVTFTTIPNEYKEGNREISFVKTVDVDRISLFELMADVAKYPEIFPDNISSIIVQSKDKNKIIAIESLVEAGISTSLTAEHNLIPYSEHSIEILDGDAKDTKIIILFAGNESHTTLTVKINLHVKGILAPFAYLPSSNYESAFNTVLDSFVKYLNNN